MTAAPVQDPTTIGTTTPRVMHIYLPWSLPGYPGIPPVGAEAICGHIRESDSPRSVHADSPDACVICTELIELQEYKWTVTQGPLGLYARFVCRRTGS